MALGITLNVTASFLPFLCLHHITPALTQTGKSWQVTQTQEVML